MGLPCEPQRRKLPRPDGTAAQHWSTLPILVYRALWWFVGLRHYWPYELCLVLFHLTAAVLLRAVMRRAGVSPWIATAAASLFAFYGAGRQDIVFAFQIGFTGALAFGLAHVLLADHDGSFDRRDVIGLAFGVLALMCSAVGVTMALAVGIATFVRRGWRMVVTILRRSKSWRVSSSEESSWRPRPATWAAASKWVVLVSRVP